jgi:hypothetical protein
VETAFGEELERHVDDLLACAGAPDAHHRAGGAVARPADALGLSHHRTIVIAFGSMSPSFRTGTCLRWTVR